MKTVRYCTILGCAILAANSLRAENDIAREMRQLQEDYTKAVSAAMDPLNRRYQASLEQLLKRATLEKDADTAAKIQEQLTSLQAAAASPNAKPRHTREWLQQLLLTSEWVWSSKPDDHTNSTHVTFTKDQFLMSGKPFCPYKIIDPFTVELDKRMLKFADDYKSFEVSSWTDGTPRFGHRTY